MLKKTQILFISAVFTTLVSAQIVSTTKMDSHKLPRTFMILQKIDLVFVIVFTIKLNIFTKQLSYNWQTLSLERKFLLVSVAYKHPSLTARKYNNVEFLGNRNRDATSSLTIELNPK